MERITDEMTALSGMKLTIDLIKNGECLEFDPEKKIDKRKSYTLLDPVTKIIGLYTKDLQQAYQTIEQLEAELAESKKTVEQVSAAAKKSAEQVKQVLLGEKKFGEAEQKLAELMASVEELRQSHADDGALIANLKQQIEDVQSIADEVPVLKDDVQFVLNALQKSLEEAGIDPEELLDGVDDE